jgi:peptidoglycan/xylan/chitin deacetylase (PgdA/CDA1 family)
MTNPSATQLMWKVLKKPFSLAARSLMGTITHVETSDPVLALTFDDGPHPEYTLRLLDVLDKYHAKATFFCVGKYAAKHPDVIRQVALAGHVVGNHGWGHASFPLLSHHERCAAIKQCAEALKPYGSRLFRPPYGHQSIASRLDLLRCGYLVVGWTRQAGDGCLTNCRQIVAQVLPGIRPGRIILFHDRIATARSAVYFNREPMIDAVEQLLQRFSEDYRFVTVPELVRCGQPVRENWYHDADASWLNELIEEGNVPGRQYSLSTEERVDAPFYM